LAIAPGQTAVVSLTGGTPPFTAFPVNNVLVSVSTLGSAVSVTGLQETSEALVRIVDTAGVSRILPVAVSAQISNTPNASLFTNLPARPVLPPLSSRTYTISGGTPPYNVMAAQPAVLLPQVRGAALILQTGQVGTSQLTITDAAGFRLTYTVQVQGVMSPLSLSATEFSSVVGEKTGVWISGGRPPYRVHTTNGVASGVIRDGNVLWLELMAAGNGIVTVYDADLNQVTMTVNAEKSSLPDKFTLAPQKVTISESLTFDASGNPQATVVPLRLTKAVSPVSVFSSYPGLLIPTFDGTFVSVHTPYQDGKPVPPCIDDDVIVTITVIDGMGQSASTDITIRDTGACTP
jgi:hypothetical protein